jgi:glycosyltransferase involved in cell wall biosynthesis
MLGISVVIPTYNEENSIGIILEALKPQVREGDEIVIVDSYSTDRTLEIARRYTDRIFSMPREGIGPAKNLGAQKASNEIVAFLDADGPPKENWMDVIRKRFEEPETNAMAGLGLYSSEGRFSEMTYNLFARSIFFMGWMYYRMTRVPWLPVNNCAIRKSLLHECGGYGNVVCEDLDFAVRAKGLKGVLYDPKMLVTLSDRRFKDEGFLRTVWLWFASDLKILGGGGIDSRQYRATR